jgi:hypothetical protein
VVGVALASSRKVQDCARVGLAAIGNVLLRLMNTLVDVMWKLLIASVESCQLAALHNDCIQLWACGIAKSVCGSGFPN